MNSTLGRKLTDGLLARLDFDYACNRGHSFGEYHLHGVVNEVISANIDPKMMRVHANFAHSAIARKDPGRGRHPELDFYIQSRDGTAPSVCAEVKWAGSSHASAKRVLLDVIRLALVKQSEPSTECLFILAGGNAELRKLLLVPPLATEQRGSRGLLERPRATKDPRKRSFPLVAAGVPITIIDKEAQEFLTMPNKVSTTLVTPAAFDTKRWQSLVWRVSV